MTDSTRGRVKPSTAALFRLLSLLAAVPVLALSLFRAVPAEWPVLVVQLLSFTPWLAIPALVALLLAFVGRSRWQQVLTGVLLVCQVFWLFPPNVARPAEASEGARVELKAMNINSEFGQADAAGIVRLVRENGVGLLTIQEHSQGLQDRLSVEGLDTLLPVRVSDPTDDAGGYAVYSRYPLELVGLLPDTSFKMPTVRLTAGANGSVAVLEVTTVHAFPPVDDRVSQWRKDLAAVGRVAERAGNTLLIGDFNATYDDAEFQDILARRQAGNGAGMIDVAAASGSRLVPTWPMDGQPLPGITIDHLVTSAGLGSSGYEVHKVAGTDHAAVLATLAIPGA
ncbi:endonuclease/exonuclease/phosphatase family protein [Arthrobacter sp. ISL-48]|uniref:endonuclease/exonuclease/phosphatase family protein n=1 Tax=Arthrobacter sp. ISL-48 TaxID=2819110 RepID=UPI001BE9BBF3|nr:endonuclease/exonuclease/phosphatase family protein [Arthrobacter sp. ISL-48]MBT2531558.1 endonuclease/exonuclease/phosphatase family protein [Arthrobacter sp. ISL-48]